MSSPQKPLLDVLCGRVPSRTPIWFMRQAGRCLSEYRSIRDRMETYDMFRTPEVACTITLQPMKRFDYDGCIVYADILHIADALGSGLSFKRGTGPVMKRVVRSVEDLRFVRKARSMSTCSDYYDFVFETLDRVAGELDDDKTLIGFAGSPWSVATYMIEGQSPQQSHMTKRLAASDPQVFAELMEHITELTQVYLLGQIHAGAEVIQIFESHAGMALNSDQYVRWCVPYVRDILIHLQTHSPQTPLIYYVNGSAGKMDQMVDLFENIKAFGVDFRQPLRAVCHYPQCQNIVLQGNLDPMDLYANKTHLAQCVDQVLTAGRAHQGGFIFNVGHGLTPDTPLHSIEQVIAQVHDSSPV